MPVPADDVPPLPPWPPRMFAIEFGDTSRFPTPKVTTPPADPPSPPRPPLPAELAAPFPPWPPHNRVIMLPSIVADGVPFTRMPTASPPSVPRPPGVGGVRPFEATTFWMVLERMEADCKFVT